LDAAQPVVIGIRADERALHTRHGDLEQRDQAVELAHEALAVLGGVEARLGERLLAAGLAHDRLTGSGSWSRARAQALQTYPRSDAREAPEREESCERNPSVSNRGATRARRP